MTWLNFKHVKHVPAVSSLLSFFLVVYFSGIGIFANSRHCKDISNFFLPLKEEWKKNFALSMWPQVITD